MSGVSVSLHQDTPIPLDLEFSCGPGQLLALVGPSGSGKSTVLRAIAGTYHPSHGRVTVDGETWLETDRGINLPTWKRRVGMVFQSYALFPHLTAAENVAAALLLSPPEIAHQEPASFWSCCIWRGWSIARPHNCRVDNSSAWRSPGPWHASQKHSCSMNLFRPSTRRHGASSTANLPACGAVSTCRSFSSHTISTRR